MEGIKEVKSDSSLGDETEKGAVFIDLPLMITMLHTKNTKDIPFSSFEFVRFVS